ncbi:MAG TPA: MarR family transcriptional regulator [Candidatus Baltobacteraceae bacterium]|jgi:DNA-binding MarR family transcriptional regulator|nr:MarR family transcriptional regulator [Candidatus Baltobacteraceae bacterium]
MNKHIEDDAFEAATEWAQGTGRRGLNAADGRVVRTLISLRVAAQRVENAVGAWVVDSDLTGAKFSLLLTLASSEQQMRLSDIRRRLGTTQANVTGLVGGLERDGFVKRIASTEDRRVTFLKLTQTGRRALDGALPSYLTQGRAALKALSSKELEVLVDLLARLSRGLDAAR